MLSSERRVGVPAVLAAALIFALSACQVRPLYGPDPAGRQVLQSLDMIDVTPTEGRVGQKVRNELTFLLNGGTPGAVAYELDLEVKSSASGIIVRNLGGLPSGGVVTVSVAYRLRTPGAKEPLFVARLARQASFERSNQRFANDRALIDAEDRAAREAAEAIRLALSTFVASGGRSVPGISPEVSPSFEDLTDIPEPGEVPSNDPFAPDDEDED